MENNENLNDEMLPPNDGGAASNRGRIIPVNIEEQMKTSYIDYSMSVIVGRALPDVRDGLKPVHRRVLFGMNELSNYSNKAYKKSARIVGEVMGNSILMVMRPFMILWCVWPRIGLCVIP
jgi:DNA gyrase/topoisomerase IV subunit A